MTYDPISLIIHAFYAVGGVGARVYGQDLS